MLLSLWVCLILINLIIFIGTTLYFRRLDKVGKYFDKVIKEVYEYNVQQLENNPQTYIKADYPNVKKFYKEAMCYFWRPLESFVTADELIAVAWAIKSSNKEAKSSNIKFN